MPFETKIILTELSHNVSVKFKFLSFFKLSWILHYLRLSRAIRQRTSGIYNITEIIILSQYISGLLTTRALLYTSRKEQQSNVKIGYGNTKTAPSLRSLTVRLLHTASRNVRFTKIVKKQFIKFQSALCAIHWNKSTVVPRVPLRRTIQKAIYANPEPARR